MKTKTYKCETEIVIEEVGFTLVYKRKLLLRK